ncbi:alpha/beta hydrolase [Myxococcus landrumensis]|uniref:Alpha/beta hydrolase n=2 Tax=Myxococcus landrumensis TaxID=2813577 RepID=A0ABX7NJG7_9BACT|nr:alpha/beta hydrolase [Myxococcus landrumus]
MKAITFRSGPHTLAGNLHLPGDFSESRQHPTLVVVHPGGGVKEQTAGLYAAKLALDGFVALAYDASFQGDSSGEPRHLEDPSARVEDIRAAVDHLTTLPFVQRERIGVLGICAGGGYAINAAMTDSRLKAVGAVSAVNIGAMIRLGWDGNTAPAQTLGLRDAGAARRTAEQGGEAIASMPLAPTSPDPSLPPDLRDALDYYHTARAQHRNSPSKTPLRSLSQLVGYDAFHLAELLLTQPLQLVAGSKAGSLWHSQQVLERAASRDKRLHIVEGANHMDLYDGSRFVAEALAKLVPFYREKL